MNNLAFELESNLIAPEKWTEEMLSKIPEDIQEELKSPYPSGLGFREDVGWFCLGTGQGPFIIWIEKQI